MKLTIRNKIKFALSVITVLFIIKSAVSAETITLSYGAASGIYGSDTFWTTLDSGTVLIPINIIADGENTKKYLCGYNAKVASTGGLSTENYRPVNKIDSWNVDGNTAVNNGMIACSAVSAPLEISDSANIFGIEIDTDSLTLGNTYIVSLVDDDKLPAFALSGTVDTVTSSNDVVPADKINSPASFSFISRTAPLINSISFAGYTGSPVSEFPSSITFYIEHGDIPVNLGVTGYDSDLDTVEWSREGNLFIISEPDESDNSLNKKLTGLTEGTSGKLKVRFTEGPADSTLEKVITISVENWIKDETTGSFDFETPYSYTFIVGAGKTTASENNEWDSGVDIPELTRGGKSEVWSFTPSYTIPDGKSFSISNTEGDGNNISLNLSTVDDPSKRVTITLTGYNLGDVNKDSGVDIIDSAVIGIHVIRMTEATPFTSVLTGDKLIYADCNSADGDGVINVADVLAINRHLVGDSPW